MIDFLIVALGTALCSAIYRFGGARKRDDVWDVLRWSKTRDWGCPLVVIGMLLLLGMRVEWYWHVAAFVGMWAALSTYLDKIFGHDNFYAHGLLIGFACLIYAIPLGLSFAFYASVRGMAMAAFMGLWCWIFENDIIEECGRGAVIGMTVPLLLI